MRLTGNPSRLEAIHPESLTMRTSSSTTLRASVGCPQRAPKAVS
ncbi:hypothetical protein [Rothia dentocariosa]|nr:hypothetical protein [Rothia dentocariosa]